MAAELVLFLVLVGKVRKAGRELMVEEAAMVGQEA
jgi:hypothetical protein